MLFQVTRNGDPWEPPDTDAFQPGKAGILRLVVPGEESRRNDAPPGPDDWGSSDEQEDISSSLSSTPPIDQIPKSPPESVPGRPEFVLKRQRTCTQWRHFVNAAQLTEWESGSV